MVYYNVSTRPVIWRLNPISLMALSGIIGPVILLIADFLAARSAEASHYDYVLHSISSLAWTPMGYIQTIGFLTIGLLVEIFAAGLFLSIRGRRCFGLGILCLVAFGFGLLLVGAFHTDLPGEAATLDGMIHQGAANTIFFMLPLAVLLMLPSLKLDPYWRSLFPGSLVLAVLALAWMLIYVIWLPDNLSWFGLYERILLYIEILWVEIMAIWMLRLSLMRRVGLTPTTAVDADINIKTR
jgi:hypothetical protein